MVSMKSSSLFTMENREEERFEARATSWNEEDEKPRNERCVRLKE